MCLVHRSWRKVKSPTAAPRSTSAGMRELTDVDFPKAERIRVVFYDRGYGEVGLDFLTSTRYANNIVTNPVL